jgi:hypothetical protein
MTTTTEQLEANKISGVTKYPQCSHSVPGLREPLKVGL